MGQLVESGAELDAIGPRGPARRTEPVVESRHLRGGDAALLPEHYAPASNRDILIRLQNNKKVRLLKAKQVAEALVVVEDMLMFAPANAGLWHEAGLLHSHLGNLRAATVALEQCRDLSLSPQDKHRVAQLIGELRNRLN